MVSDQPPEIEPKSWATSSTTYSFQVPLGDVPLNTDKADPYGPPGAGLLQVSLPIPSAMFVGLYVPELNADAGSVDAAATSNVTRAAVVGPPPPQSDINTTVWPAGPTSRMSTSLVYVCESEVSVAVTFVIVPVRPATVMFDGYGEPLPLSGMVMNAPVGNGAETPEVAVPSAVA